MSLRQRIRGYGIPRGERKRRKDGWKERVETVDGRAVCYWLWS
jgi:hypothetical protein